MFLYWVYAGFFRSKCGRLATKDKITKEIKKYFYSILDEKWVPEKMRSIDIKRMEYFNLLKKNDAKAWWKEEFSFQQQYGYRKLHEKSMEVLEKFVFGKDENTLATARGEKNRAIKRKIFDIPIYDPLWGAEAGADYLYISWRYFNREDYVTCQYKHNSMNMITADIPRLVVDFPYMKKEDARKL